MTREEKLKVLKKALEEVIGNFIMWGTSDPRLAEDIDMIMSEIQEIEETIRLEKEILKKIKKKS
ncbi:MAG TPA: hypothetical protein DCX14_08330 [Flavobacteriales bacterium]|nr:hypothetical protein [Flavobacteriales bacterium]